ncbi:MAG: hypothetical protein OXI95_11935 [bacterium]|nr:hypothetical protein [bacterium]MDE0417630.1 hypothetical protein [bacterium]
MTRLIPVSTLARFAADPHGFRNRQRTSTAAARHGIRWHERLAAPRRPSRWWPWMISTIIAASAALAFAFVIG